MNTNLPTVLQTFITATNAADTEKYLSTFAETALIDDWGRKFHGISGAESWNKTDNIGVQMHFDVHGFTQKSETEFVVEITASSKRFNGNGALHFTLNAAHTKIEILRT